MMTINYGANRSGKSRLTREMRAERSRKRKKGKGWRSWDKMPTVIIELRRVGREIIFTVHPDPEPNIFPSIPSTLSINT